MIQLVLFVKRSEESLASLQDLDNNSEWHLEGLHLHNEDCLGGGRKGRVSSSASLS